MQTLNISVTDDQKKMVDNLVLKMGFANRSEFFRTALRKIKVQPQIIEQHPPVQLSKKAIKRYDKMTEEIESGKIKTFKANSVEELMDHLTGKITK
jgi:Arc/MetJ-type ribon-helix-helix transcriptional regulator